MVEESKYLDNILEESDPNIVLDDDYAIYCPWMGQANPVGKTWSDEMTDAAVELFESQKANREQRKRKRAQRGK